MYRTIYHIKLIKQGVVNRCLLCWRQRTIMMKSKKKKKKMLLKRKYPAVDSFLGPLKKI